MRRGAGPVIVLLLWPACGDERTAPERPSERPRASPAGPPDAGTRFGHGADDAQRRGGRVDRVVVPEVDRTPPSATIRAAGAVAVSPSSADDRTRPITLRSRRFRATATTIDRDGGTGRVRVSVSYAVRCGERVRRVTEHRPPAQTARVRLAPGVEAPVRRVRRATVRLRVGPGCTARGDVFADASNAHGLDATSRHLRFVHASPG